MQYGSRSFSVLTIHLEAAARLRCPISGGFSNPKLDDVFDD